MTGLTPFFITGYSGGLQTDRKPFLLPDRAWAQLENAYTWRERVKKREGLKLLGRLRRVIMGGILYSTVAGAPKQILYNLLSTEGVAGIITAVTNANPGQVTSPLHNLATGDAITINNVSGMTQLNGNSYIVTVLGVNTFNINVDTTAFTPYVSGGTWTNDAQPNAEIQPGSVFVSVGPPDTATFTDNGDGTFTVTGIGLASGSSVNYSTGIMVLNFSVAVGGATVTVNYNYFPSLPVMGIPRREIAAINDEQTIWFDEKYAYVWNGSAFNEFIPGTDWSSSDSDFFAAYNYRGTNPQDRLFFVTNFVNNAQNPIRYTDGVTWTNFAPLITATDTLYQARILVAYYGRLLALNVYEGTTAGGYGGAVNIANRCRFSQLGSPIAVDAWRSDQFGKGGFLDAPTNEAIIGATFIKNTLVIDFEQTTWQLRYVGEYGLPFIWERVSADFGSESTFSGVLFDNHRLAVGDKGITAANAAGVDRIDLDIPDQIFQFKNANNGVKRVFGVRDYQRELVFWNYPDAQTEAAPGVSITFPNKVLLYNYRNNTWAIFRDSITAFGTFQLSGNITWDSLDTFWDDEDITWDDFDSQSLFPAITSGNQQGFVHLYGYVTPDESSLTITSVDLTTTPIQLTSPNHNLQDGEIIYIQGLMFVNSSSGLPVSTSLNDTIYQVSVIDVDTISISLWDFTTQQYGEDFPFTPNPATSSYIGGGTIILFPKLNIRTKDINLFQTLGLQTKLSRIDFLMEATISAAMSVILFINASPAVKGNLLVGNKSMSTNLTKPFYPPSSDYAWFRFYATLAAQYFNINVTYDDNLMNTLTTQQQDWTLYAINAWCRKGGKNVF